MKLNFGADLIEFFNDTVVHLRSWEFEAVFLRSSSGYLLELPMKASLASKTAFIAYFKTRFIALPEQILRLICANTGYKGA